MSGNLSIFDSGLDRLDGNLATSYQWGIMELQIKKNIYWILGFVALIWIIEFINFFLGHRLNSWGILPRTLTGLKGIPLSPFLHSSIMHALFNTIPFAVLGAFVMLDGKQVFLKTSIIIIFVSGIALWLFGRLSYHVGTSGLIFGYFGYLVLRAWYKRSLKSFVLAFFTVFLCGGILWGVIPTSSRISWEGHLFGILAGILAARLEKTKKNGK
ncbi:MAG: rhomboid family intramembrane serine protease [Candidatus Brocadiaceae bacterium]|nr:rhomboid family intramembrane serine protease [Candidatus Brocadiaceae bacterium]